MYNTWYWSQSSIGLWIDMHIEGFKRLHPKNQVGIVEQVWAMTHFREASLKK